MQIEVIVCDLCGDHVEYVKNGQHNKWFCHTCQKNVMGMSTLKEMKEVLGEGKK